MGFSLIYPSKFNVFKKRATSMHAPTMGIIKNPNAASDG